MGRCQSAEVIDREWSNNEDLVVGPGWCKKTSRTLEYCKGPVGRCINADCNGGNPFKLYTGTKKKRGSRVTNSRKGSCVPQQDIKRIWNEHKVAVNPRAMICKACSFTLKTDIQSMRFECGTIHHPSLSTLDAMTMKYDIEECASDDDDDEDNSDSDKTRHNRTLLDIDSMTDEKVKTLTGISRGNMQRILDQVNPALKSGNEAVLKLWQLFIAFFVWRSAIGYRSAAVLFGYADHTGIGKVCDRVRDALFIHYVPLHIGSGAWTAERVQERTPEFVRTLYPDRSIGGIGDASYAYREKSRRHHQHQRTTYCSYKGRNCLKIHAVVSPMGDTIALDGPYLADGSNKDDKIWDSIALDPNHDIHRILNPNDHTLVMDRGYMSCYQGDDAFDLIWPSKWEEDDEKQLTQDEANEGR